MYHKPKMAYAKRNKKAGTRQFVGLKLSPSTIEKVNELKALFSKKYPKDRWPSVSGIMNSLIDSQLTVFERDKDQLNAELRDFRERYSTKVNHA